MRGQATEPDAMLSPPPVCLQSVACGLRLVQKLSGTLLDASPECTRSIKHSSERCDASDAFPRKIMLLRYQSSIIAGCSPFCNAGIKKKKKKNFFFLFFFSSLDATALHRCYSRKKGSNLQPSLMRCLFSPFKLSRL